MIIIRCPYELVIGCVHKIPYPPDLIISIVHELPGCYTGCFRLFFYLDTVLIGTCLKEYIISLLSLVSRYCIRKHYLIGISDMRLAGSVGYGCRNIISSSVLCHLYISFKKNNIVILSQYGGYIKKTLRQ